MLITSMLIIITKVFQHNYFTHDINITFQQCKIQLKRFVVFTFISFINLLKIKEW